MGYQGRFLCFQYCNFQWSLWMCGFTLFDFYPLHFIFPNWKLKENFHKVIFGHLHDIFFSSNLNLKYIIALTTVHCKHLIHLQDKVKYHLHIFFVFCFAVFLFILLIYFNFVTSMSEIFPFSTWGAVSTRCLFDEVPTATILQNKKCEENRKYDMVMIYL